MKQDMILYAGTYSDENQPGILAYYLKDNGELTLGSMVRGIENPSYLTLSSDNSILYAVSETMTFEDMEGGSVAAFLTEGNDLKLINRMGCRGTLPCHILLDEERGFLYVSNYMSGSVAMFTLRQDGGIGELCDLRQHEGFGADPDRQEGPHVHFTGFSGDKNGIWCVDLGIDTVKYYDVDQMNGKLRPVPEKNLLLPGGSGPRHFVLHPQNPHVMYLVCELSSQVFVVDTREPGGNILQGISTLDPHRQTKKSTCAAIRVSGDGRYLYVSNRGDDSIAVFSIGEKTMLLTPRQVVGTGGQTPRDFVLWENRLFAANQDSGTIAVFHTGDSGRLHDTGQIIDCHSPVCLVVST